jgi:hypothetical protein
MLRQKNQPELQCSPASAALTLMFRCSVVTEGCEVGEVYLQLLSIICGSDANINAGRISSFVLVICSFVSV